MIRLLIAAISAIVGALACAVLFMVAGLPRTVIGWGWAVLAFLIGATIARVCLSLGLNTSNALQQGAREAASDSRGDSYEATGRRAGAVVGRGLNRVARIGAPKPSAPATPPAGESDPSTASGTTDAPPSGSSPTRPDVTVDRAARVIGSMVGRRTAERRNRP